MSIICISLPAMSSCSTLGNMFVPFDIITRFEICRRTPGKHSLRNKHYKYENAVDFHSKLVDTISVCGCKNYIAFSMWKDFEDTKDDENYVHYEHVLNHCAEQKVLWSENGVGIDIEHVTQYKEHLFNHNKTTGKLSVKQPNTHIDPKVISIDELLETHYVLSVPLFRDKSKNLFPRQASFDLLLAISKKTPLLEMYFYKHDQHIDHVADLYLFVEFMLEMMEQMKYTPTVLIDHVISNTSFKGSLAPFKTSASFAQDVFKLHFSSFIANCIGVAKQHLTNFNNSRVEDYQWRDPISTNLIELYTLLQEENIEYLVRGQREDIRLQKIAISQYTLSWKSLLKTLGASSHAHTILFNMLHTRHGGVAQSAIQGSHIVDSNELEIVDERIKSLAKCDNYDALFIYYTYILNKIAKDEKYNQILCNDKILMVPLEIDEGYLIYKIPTQIFEKSEMQDTVLVEQPISKWQTSSKKILI